MYLIITASTLPDVLQKIALLPDVRGRPRSRRAAAAALVDPAAAVDVVWVEVAVVDVYDVGDGEDADEAGPQVGALAPQVLRLLLHVHRVADVDLDLVLNEISTLGDDSLS